MAVEVSLSNNASHSSRQGRKPHLSVRLPSLLPAYIKLGRLHSLSGAFYLLVPCWWGLALALSNTLPDTLSDTLPDALFNGLEGQASEFSLPLLLPFSFPLLSSLLFAFFFPLLFAVLFAVAAVAARAAGCAWNDLCDYAIDKQTVRTQTRPLPKGDLSKRQALLFVLLALLVSGACLLALLALAKNPVLLLSLVCVVLPVAAFYPFAKRFVSAPQVVLGIAFNWGILCANLALAGSVSRAALTLWLGAVAWTTFYDTIYAWQDIEDDRRTKMNSLTLWLEKKRQPKLWLAALYAFFLASAFLSLAAKDGGASGGEVGTWLACLLLLALWCYADLARCNLRNARHCMAFFRKECWRTGGGILLLLLLATLV